MCRKKFMELLLAFKSDIMEIIDRQSKTFFHLKINTFDNITFTYRHAGNDNLKFLTVEQILADIPHLIDSIRKEYNATKKSRIILCGSGFGGTLAAWARQKYPHLVYGVWSSSGIFHRVLHTKEPYESLTLTIREYGGSKCAENVAEAFDKILESVLLYELEYLKSIFNLCDLLWLYNEDIGMFYNGLINYIITYFNAYK